MTLTSQIADMTSSSSFFDVVLLLLSILVTGSSFMSISSLVLKLWQFSYIRGWPEIGNTPVWILANIWRLGQDRDSKFGKNVSNKILRNAAKCQGYSFYHFWVIKEKPIGEIKLPHPPHRLGLINLQAGYYFFYFNEFSYQSAKLKVLSCYLLIVLRPSKLFFCDLRCYICSFQQSFRECVFLIHIGKAKMITRINLLNESNDQRMNRLEESYSITFLKKRLQHICFSVNFVEFLRTHFYRTFLHNSLNQIGAQRNVKI